MRNRLSFNSPTVDGRVRRSARRPAGLGCKWIIHRAHPCTGTHSGSRNLSEAQTSNLKRRPTTHGACAVARVAVLAHALALVYTVLQRKVRRRPAAELDGDKLENADYSNLRTSYI